MSLILKLLLALVYLIAGGSKLFNLFLFKATILAYYPFLPEGLALLIALIFPWLELLGALSIVLNWKPKAGSSFLFFLSIVFLVQMILNYSHILPYGCGCFGFGQAEQINGYYIVRDLLIAGLAGIVCFREWRK